MTTNLSKILDTVIPEFEPLTRQEEAQLYRGFFGQGKNKYQVYPDNWDKRWGQAPLLGIVFADNTFLAERIAYDCGVLPTPNNATFGPKFKLVGSAVKQA